jgi:DNA ligase (NAD+)
MSKTAAGEVDQLREQIRHHDELYYQKAKPEISDQDYDALMRKLAELEAAHPDLAAADSPTHRVGGKPIDGFVQVKHAVRMMSIDNTYDEAEVRDFDDRIKRLLGGEAFSYTCEPKVDGGHARKRRGGRRCDPERQNDPHDATEVEGDQGD